MLVCDVILHPGNSEIIKDFCDSMRNLPCSLNNTSSDHKEKCSLT